MNLFVLLAASLISGDADACTYDEEDQLEKLSALASSKSGHLNESAREVTWNGPNGEKYTVVYGGCDHLGHMTTVVGLVKVMPTEPELVAISLKLADELWWGGEGKLLKRALASGEFTRNAEKFGLRIDIVGTDYSEMYVESRAEAEAVVVALGWVRTF